MSDGREDESGVGSAWADLALLMFGIVSIRKHQRMKGVSSLTPRAVVLFSYGAMSALLCGSRTIAMEEKEIIFGAFGTNYCNVNHLNLITLEIWNSL